MCENYLRSYPFIFKNANLSIAIYRSSLFNKYFLSLEVVIIIENKYICENEIISIYMVRRVIFALLFTLCFVSVWSQEQVALPGEEGRKAARNLIISLIVNTLLCGEIGVLSIRRDWLRCSLLRLRMSSGWLCRWVCLVSRLSNQSGPQRAVISQLRDVIGNFCLMSN